MMDGSEDEPKPHIVSRGARIGQADWQRIWLGASGAGRSGREVPPVGPGEGNERNLASRGGGYEGILSTCPGLILSGSVRTSRLASKIFVYLLASPRCALAIALSVSPAFTV